MLNFAKVEKLLSSIGANIDYKDTLSNISNLLPRNLGEPLYNTVLNLGRAQIRYNKKVSLMNLLENDKNVLKLIFPFIDYGFNFSKSNDLKDYDLAYLPGSIDEGSIVPKLALKTGGDVRKAVDRLRNERFADEYKFLKSEFATEVPFSSITIRNDHVIKNKM